MKNEKFNFKSYEAHANWYEKKDSGLKRLENKESISYWRFERMCNLLKPLLKEEKNWLTVGDGIGTDANWLINKNQKVIASDIADTLLKKAKDIGYINEYSKENAENLKFESQQFDYVLCKEAYHHFPRPYIALYEMIRVASEAVIIIEPVDIGIQMPPILFLKNILDRFNPNLINKVWKNRYSFETVGNYVYKISEREMEKVAMGINLPAIAFKGINDYYSKSLNFSAPITNKKIFNKVKSKIKKRDLMCKLGLIPYELMSCIIFKKLPSQETKDALLALNYKYIELPDNPYLNQ